jgi:DNA polymerase III subunit gamma/tau
LETATAGGAQPSGSSSGGAYTPSGGGQTVNVRTASSMPGSVASGSTMRLVSENPETAPSFTPAILEPLAPVEQVTSLADILALADRRRDMQMKVLIRSCVRPVSIRPGVLEIGLTSDAPRGFASDLSRKLSEWAGQRFMVSVVADAKAMTMDETENAKRDGMMADAKADPDVAAILARFPGAKIINVRIETAPGAADMDIGLGSDTPDDFAAQSPDVDTGADDDE